MTPRKRMSASEKAFLLGQIRAQTYTSACLTLNLSMDREFKAGYDAGMAAGAESLAHALDNIGTNDNASEEES